MKYKLLNFDHGSKYPENYCVGPFNIQITDQHCENINYLPRNETITFGWDKNFNRVIKENSRRRGSWIETATVEISKSGLQPSVIFPKKASKKSIDDLCLFLSFTSGRAVSLEDNPFIDQLSPDVHTDKVVHYGYFSRSDFCWENLSKLQMLGLAGQFYNLTMAYQSHDFVATAVHYSNALNVAYEKWYKKHPTMFIDKDTRQKICEDFRQCLGGISIKDEICEDILNRVENIFNPSAIFKLKHFLKEIELYPVDELPGMHERLQWLNRVRNSMAHTGMLPKDKKLSDDLLGSVTSIIVDLVLRINQYYFGKEILELDDPYLEFIKGLITPYFHEGKYLHRQIFSEKYEEYMERAKQEWLAVDR